MTDGRRIAVNKRGQIIPKKVSLWGVIERLKSREDFGAKSAIRDSDMVRQKIIYM